MSKYLNPYFYQEIDSQMSTTRGFSKRSVAVAQIYVYVLLIGIACVCFCMYDDWLC